jgi:hypothetical protein
LTIIPSRSTVEPGEEGYPGKLGKPCTVSSYQRIHDWVLQWIRISG